MYEQCVLCPSSLFYYTHSDSAPTSNERYELFHQPCSSGCTLPSSYRKREALDSNICDFCEHLRLRHLVNCVKPDIRMRFLFPLRKGLLAKQNPKNNVLAKKCSLCSFVTRMVSVGLSSEQLSEVKGAGNSDIVLYLGLPQNQDSQSGGPGVPLADIYVSYSDGSGVSNVWIGDIHIDQIKKDGPVIPLVGEVLSWLRLEDKINECYNEHSECQRPVGTTGASALPKGFRVIDVIRRCLVERSDIRCFVALSYVWGAKPSSLLAATRTTIDGMKKDGGLPTSAMPKTIEDAITVCLQMGQRYLWVDRLCIIQDDGGDKKNQIEAMDNIFSSAQIVLIAAYGDNMDFGIPGVSRLRRKIVQHSEDMFGLRITNIVREIEDDPLTLWVTRGWTYQEAVLSRRRLYFTNTRVFFECERSMCHEDQFNGERSRDELISSRLTISDDESPFRSFARHLRHYTSRKLTYRSDAYEALYGISKSIYSNKNSGTDTMMMINGLPRVDFDRALLWYANIGKNPIMRLETTQGTILPTWSWSSIMGLAEDQVHYQATSFYGTLAPWYSINGPSPFPSGPGATTIEAFNVLPDSKSPDDDWQVYMAVACMEGCMGKERNLTFSLSLQTDNFSTVREKFNKRWKDYRSFCQDAIPSTIETTKLPPPQSVSQGINPKLGGVVAIKSQSAFLNLQLKPSYSFNIINSLGERIGELCGDAEKLREEHVQAKAPGSGIAVSNSKFEFIALSLSGIGIMPYSSKDLGPKNYVDADGNPLDKVPIVNVLMIAWDGDFARRRELGWVYLVDWVKLRREWKLVTLA
ncbi:hypothetical protein ACJ72_00835 [Emergomyces africanus]|uniref:Heterokaryon incompatibility domain-containing protein n=1 Tax=Emergomyces africanus TaxID=1955775 RepID=A0A1B7P6X5_9EURO|nr:hypothetical protein ACJ72_00835 [Emergomyces africanus]